VILFIIVNMLLMVLYKLQDSMWAMQLLISTESSLYEWCLAKTTTFVTISILLLLFLYHPAYVNTHVYCWFSVFMAQY